MIWLCQSEIFCKNGLSKGLKIFHFSFTHYVNREEAAGKTRLRFFSFCNMLHNGYSQSVDINIRSKLIQKFNEYHALSCSLKYKEDSISFQSSYFFLNLLIYSNWLFKLFFFLFFHFSIGFYRFGLSCNNCSDVKVRIQFFDPIIQYIKDFFDTPLLFIGVARYHEPCDPLLDFVGPLGLLKLLLVEWLLILGTSFLLSLHFIYSIMVIGVYLIIHTTIDSIDYIAVSLFTLHLLFALLGTLSLHFHLSGWCHLHPPHRTLGWLRTVGERWHLQDFRRNGRC